MPGGNEEVGKSGHGPKERQAIGTSRAETRPTPLHRGIGQFRCQADGKGQQCADGPRRRAFVEADLLFRGAYQHLAVRPRHEVSFALEQDPAKKWPPRIEQGDLAPDRMDPRMQSNLFQERVRPRPRGQEKPACRQPAGACFDRRDGLALAFQLLDRTTRRKPTPCCWHQASKALT